ncbi:MAG: ribonuclease Y [Turicibacter sp.]|nr:ribonuclease Y [Turicibacter sp.]
MTLTSIILVGVVAVFCLFAGFLAGILYRKKVAESKLGSAEIEAENIIEEAKRTAEARSKELLLEAKEESIKTKNEADKDAKERRNESQRLERRLIQKEETLDRKLENQEKKEEQLRRKMDQLERERETAARALALHQKELERISGLTTDEAKRILISTIEVEAKFESAKMVRDIEQRARNEANKKARDIIATAVQRCAVDHIAETTVSVVQLPNDEMKGRIIGREGRNIRTLESLTGVDLIIDDTPEAVVLSGFDPMRREIARIALEKLVIDGRVHPARIEEMVEKAKKEVDAIIKEEGEAAIFETGIHGIHNEIVKLLGKMKFRTSYGQNMLKHSIEVAYLSGLIASELGADIKLAKRAGLLHDIGKAINHDTAEGSHVAVGVSICRKYREPEAVINTVESHHGDVEPTSIIAIIAQAADAISGARPGARREPLESYVKRLEKLEALAESFSGVEKSFAMQAGRELRIIILPDQIDDLAMTVLARDVAKRVEEELEYPGQIKISLVRETRVVEYAR